MEKSARFFSPVSFPHSFAQNVENFWFFSVFPLKIVRERGFSYGVLHIFHIKRCGKLAFTLWKNTGVAVENHRFGSKNTHFFTSFTCFSPTTPPLVATFASCCEASLFFFLFAFFDTKHFAFGILPIFLASRAHISTFSSLFYFCADGSHAHWHERSLAHACLRVRRRIQGRRQAQAQIRPGIFPACI